MKRMSIREFMDFGFLQEANRLFFHPLGLALEVTIDDETGECYLSAVQDYRDDPAGIIFDELDLNKTVRVLDLIVERSNPRVEKLGYMVQPAYGEKV